MSNMEDLKNYLLLNGLRKAISEDCQSLSNTALGREPSFLLKKIRDTKSKLSEYEQILLEVTNLK